MKKNLRLNTFIFLTLSFVSFAFFFSQPVFAQEAPAAAAEGTEEETLAPMSEEQSFWDVVWHSGWYGILDWFGIFATSAATLGLIIDGLITIRPRKIMPAELINAVRESLNQGDLGTALEACDATPGSLANILRAGFNNVSEGFDVIMDCVGGAADMEVEKLMQRINYLNLCSALAPMLGLLGTVTGMVDAFSGLATTTGAAKQAMIALAISQALYTTVFGLIISIPAVLGYTYLKNGATRIALNMESLTFDLLKVLRSAEVVDEEETQE